MRLARTKAAQRVAALRARAGRERGRVQEYVRLVVLVEVGYEDLLHVGQVGGSGVLGTRSSSSARRRSHVVGHARAPLAVMVDPVMPASYPMAPTSTGVVALALWQMFVSSWQMAGFPSSG